MYQKNYLNLINVLRKIINNHYKTLILNLFNNKNKIRLSKASFSNNLKIKKFLIKMMKI